MSDLTQKSHKDGTLSMTRSFQARPTTVFAAWTDPQIMNLWYGPEGVLSVRSHIEARTGGAYAHEMTFGNGKTHRTDGTITRIDPPQYLAYSAPGPTPDQTMSVELEFAEQNGHTLLHLTQKPLSEQMSAFVAPAWEAAFAKLDKLLQKP